MTPKEGARLPMQYALEGDKSGQFVEPGGLTHWWGVTVPFSKPFFL